MLALRRLEHGVGAVTLHRRAACQTSQSEIMDLYRQVSSSSASVLRRKFSRCLSVWRFQLNDFIDLVEMVFRSVFSDKPDRVEQVGVGRVLEILKRLSRARIDESVDPHGIDECGAIFLRCSEIAIWRDRADTYPVGVPIIVSTEERRLLSVQRQRPGLRAGPRDTRALVSRPDHMLTCPTFGSLPYGGFPRKE